MKVEAVSKSEYARRRGWNKSAINGMMARSVFTPDGKVDVKASDARFAETASPSGAAMTERFAAARAAKIDDVDPQKKVDEANQTYDSLAKTRLRSEKLKVELLQAELDELQGRLVRSEDVRRAASKAGREARSAILNVPARLGPVLAAESDPARCIALLEAELRAVCSAIAGE